MSMNPTRADITLRQRICGIQRVLGSLLSQAAGKGRKSAALPEETAPATRDAIPCRPALFDPGQLDRVLACGFGKSLAKELDKLQARSFSASPKKEYVLRDAVIAGGRIYTRQEHYFLSSASPLRALKKTMQCHDTATLLNSLHGLKYFGHWLRDDCAVYEDVRDRPNLLSLERPDWPDARMYEHAFGQVWPEVSLARVGALTLYREMGFNRDKARRLRILRDRLRTACTASNAGRIVYMRRGRQGAARDISNQDALETALSAAGVHVVEPGIAGQDLVREILDSEMIITVEGSQASHGVYCLADGGSMLVLQPPERFYNPHHEWARLMGMGYGITIGEKDERGFHIHPDEVLRMIDQLRAAAQGPDI